MEYHKYLKYMNRVEWLYDFHPDFFDELPSKDQELLKTYFLYNAPDEAYPESIENYFNDNISKNKASQNEIIRALKNLYKVAGSGELEQ